MSDMTQNSAALNQAAAHETGLYDPNIHDNQIVALYDTDTQAHAAQDVLIQAGFPASAMQVMARDGLPPSTSTAGVSGMGYERAESEGIWGSIKSLFVPDEERNTYNHAIARGHAMLVVTPGHGMDRQHLIHVLESTNPLDFDAKLEEWRQSGYDSSSAMTAATQGTATQGMATAATTSASPAPLATGYVAPTALPTALPTGTSHQASNTASHDTTGASMASPAVGDDSIKVMEERLRVGKREVASGAVRIRSYIVERPIEESVHLHEERVSVDRTPVDRPVTGADLAGAFQERTIEARATSEEAVIAKEARVVEEIGLNKQATDRVETVHDTVRKTEVEIEGADAAATHGTLHGNTEGNPNATPGAATSGANSPVK